MVSETNSLSSSDKKKWWKLYCIFIYKWFNWQLAVQLNQSDFLFLIHQMWSELNYWFKIIKPFLWIVSYILYLSSQHSFSDLFLYFSVSAFFPYFHFLLYFSPLFFPLVRVMKLKNNILYPVEGNLVTTLLPDDKLILKCLFPNPKKTEQLRK